MRDKCVPRTSLDVAARWFYLNRTSEFSTMDKVWARDRSIRLDSAALIAVVQHASRKLRGVSLTAGDFEKVIDKAPDGAFLFVAPPYSLTRSASRDSQYRVPFSRDDSVRLVEALRRNNRRVHFLLTYRECQEIVDLFSWGENICEYLHYDTRHLGDPTKLPSDEIVTDPEKVNEICIRNYA